MFVVSDQLLLRAGLRSVLEASGIVVVGEAAGCEEALPLAVQESPDVILLDLRSRNNMVACFGSSSSRQERPG